MISEFNFKSQICTSKSQSETLLKLGLKKETADMAHNKNTIIPKYKIVPVSDWGLLSELEEITYIPAWSLHRLLSLLPKYIRVRKESFGRFRWTTLELTIDAEFVVWYREDIDNSEVDENFYAEDIYTSLCDCIEWLIKEGYFDKEYLEE